MKMTEKAKGVLNARRTYYNENDVLQMNSSVKNAKNENVPFLNNKQKWLYIRLSKNVLADNYSYTLGSISNEYRKKIADDKTATAKKENYVFRKSFKTSEVFSLADLKAVIQYTYIVNRRLWIYYRNEKNNYLFREVEFIDNLTRVKGDNTTTAKSNGKKNKKNKK